MSLTVVTTMDINSFLGFAAELCTLYIGNKQWPQTLLLTSHRILIISRYAKDHIDCCRNWFWGVGGLGG